jgi:hypothetical protein
VQAPDLSPQGVFIAMRAGSVVIGAAIGASAATKNVVQRTGRPSDSGSDRGASANIECVAAPMPAPAAPPTVAPVKVPQPPIARATNRRSYTFEKICHRPPPRRDYCAKHVP